MYAISIFNEKTIKGYTIFEQTNNGVLVKVNLSGVPPGEHGFHVHEYGNMRNGCESMGPHFNPNNKNHGGRNSKERHVGDLGNIKANSKGIVKTSFLDKMIKLYGKNNIIGRGLVLHEKRDDLGLGGDEESLKTGNAGKRIACAVIALGGELLDK